MNRDPRAALPLPDPEADGLEATGLEAAGPEATGLEADAAPVGTGTTFRFVNRFLVEGGGAAGEGGADAGADAEADAEADAGSGRFDPVFDRMAVEEPLHVEFEGVAVGSTMRTPGADEDLAAGLLFSLGLVTGLGRDRALEFFAADSVLRVRRMPGSGPFGPGAAPGAARPAGLAAPGGGASGGLKPLTNQELAERLLAMRRTLEARQQHFRSTGATHCTMLFDRRGEPLGFGEDVGRHNAFDKAVGAALRAGWLSRACFGVVSSRLNHEIVSKALHTRLMVLAGFSAATTVAVDLAREHGLTLVGRLRETGMVLYT